MCPVASWALGPVCGGRIWGGGVWGGRGIWGLIEWGLGYVEVWGEYDEVYTEGVLGVRKGGYGGGRG